MTYPRMPARRSGAGIQTQAGSQPLASASMRGIDVYSSSSVSLSKNSEGALCSGEILEDHQKSRRHSSP